MARPSTLAAAPLCSWTAQQIGLAGELHPRVITDPATCRTRTVAAELDLDALVAAAAARGPGSGARSCRPTRRAASTSRSWSPTTRLAAEVEQALRDGAGPLLEQIRLFDVYIGPQVGEGSRSLAYALRFRAPDRTLTDAEVLGRARCGGRAGGRAHRSGAPRIIRLHSHALLCMLMSWGSRQRSQGPAATRAASCCGCCSSTLTSRSGRCAPAARPASRSPTCTRTCRSSADRVFAGHPADCPGRGGPGLPGAAARRVGAARRPAAGAGQGRRPGRRPPAAQRGAVGALLRRRAPRPVDLRPARAARPERPDRRRDQGRLLRLLRRRRHPRAGAADRRRAWRTRTTSSWSPPAAPAARDGAPSRTCWAPR